MSEIKLVVPSLEYGEDIMKMRSELFGAQDGDAFAGCAGLQKYEQVEDWIASNERFSSAETCPEGFVTSSVYLGVRCSDNKIVGIIDLRHHIDHPVLGLWGGHVGYIVRPDERGHGYAKAMVILALDKYREMNVDKIMITCHRGNIASERTIIASGGVFENEVLVDGEYVKRYWITL